MYLVLQSYTDEESLSDSVNEDLRRGQMLEFVANSLNVLERTFVDVIESIIMEEDMEYDEEHEILEVNGQMELFYFVDIPNPIAEKLKYHYIVDKLEETKQWCLGKECVAWDFYDEEFVYCYKIIDLGVRK